MDLLQKQKEQTMKKFKTYVMSDIHGCYDKYMKMLEKIGFSEDDTLYVLGDILDYKMDKAARTEVVRFISEFDLYKEIFINDKTYILVHAGLGRFNPDKELWEYEIDDLVWERPDYERPYYFDKYVVTGHTPTMTIRSNPRPGYIYKANSHIAIDCGAGFGGKLACMCLETMEEFYVD